MLVIKYDLKQIYFKTKSTTKLQFLGNENKNGCSQNTYVNENYYFFTKHYYTNI